MSAATAPRFSAIILDLDGTLVDTLGDFEVALNRTLADLDLPPLQASWIARQVGKGSEHLLRVSLTHSLAQAELGLANVCEARSPEALLPTAWARYQHHYDTINGQYATLFPGVPEGLALLREAGLPLACVTNKPLRFAQDLLAAKGLSGAFVQVFGGDSFARKKPDPLPLLKTCEALAVAPARTLMVGDSSNDAQAAHAAGCPVVLMTYGFNHGEPITAVPALAWLDRLDAIGPFLHN